jgi:hypothetical protein
MLVRIGTSWNACTLWAQTMATAQQVHIFKNQTCMDDLCASAMSHTVLLGVCRPTMRRIGKTLSIGARRTTCSARGKVLQCLPEYSRRHCSTRSCSLGCVAAIGAKNRQRLVGESRRYVSAYPLAWPTKWSNLMIAVSFVGWQ